MSGRAAFGCIGTRLALFRTTASHRTYPENTRSDFGSAFSSSTPRSICFTYVFTLPPFCMGSSIQSASSSTLSASWPSQMACPGTTMRCSSSAYRASRSRVVSMLSGIGDSRCPGLAASSHPEPAAYEYGRARARRGEWAGTKTKLRLSRSEPESASTSRAAARLVSRVRALRAARSCWEAEGWWWAGPAVKYGLALPLRPAFGSGSMVLGKRIWMCK